MPWKPRVPASGKVRGAEHRSLPCSPEVGGPKPARPLSRKDWLSAAKRAVVSVVSFGSLLPRRPHRRRGAAVVTARCCASTPEQAMTKLTDTQLITLSAASQREDRGVVLPPNLRGGAAQKFVAKLIEVGFV